MIPRQSIASTVMAAPIANPSAIAAPQPIPGAARPIATGPPMKCSATSATSQNGVRRSSTSGQNQRHVSRGRLRTTLAGMSMRLPYG